MTFLGGISWTFLAECISTSVGLGNVWRFPFTAYRNGGGAFLILYTIILFFLSRPLYFMELALGQFAMKNNVQVWDLSPIFRGTFVLCLKKLFLVLVSVFFLSLLLPLLNLKVSQFKNSVFLLLKIRLSLNEFMKSLKKQPKNLKDFYPEI